MIKLEANKGEVTIIEASGDGYTLMSELCCIVKAVCTGYCKDEDKSKEMTKKMVLTVAVALKCAENIDWGANLEDDENSDF